MAVFDHLTPCSAHERNNLVEGYMIMPDSPEMNEIIRKTRLTEEIRRRFLRRYTRPGNPLLYESIECKAHTFAHDLANLCPCGPELDQALNRLDEVVFWATAAIARRV